MVVCLSTNGPLAHRSDAAPTRLLVATLDGVDIIERDVAPGAWRIAAHALHGKHVSSLLFEPKGGGVFAGIHDGGLYFSADGGAHWERRANGLTIEHVFSLGCVDEPGGVTLYAGTEPVSLFRSRDYGRHWEELPAIAGMPGADKWWFPGPPHIPHAKSLAFDPRDATTFYACIEQGALLQTADGGASWREIDSYSRPDDVWYRDVHRLSLRPSNPQELFLTTGMGLYHSVDAGARWEHLTDQEFRIGYPDHLLFSPLDDRVMFMSGAVRDPTIWRQTHQAKGTVMKSRDGGRHWEPASRGLPAEGRANIEAMCVVGYPGGFSLFVGNTDGEVYCSEDGSDSWTRIAEGLKPVSKGGHFRLVTDLAPNAHA